MKPLRILLVDDEPSILKIIKKRLETFGFEVFVAADGEAGLETARQKKPDLIILDIMMPKIDGIDTCKMLKEDKLTKRIPVIMFTAKNEPDEQFTGLMSGAEGYITKSAGSEALLNKIRTVMSRHS